MSFLDTLRHGTDSTLTRIIIGVVGVAFVVSMGGRGRNASSEIYAVVDGQAITKSEFDTRMRGAARQAKRALSDEERNRLADSVLEQMILQEVQIQQADALHIGVSDEEVARILKSIDAFKKDGKFDQHTYERTLRENGQTTDRFEADVRRDLLLQKIEEFARAGVTITDAEVHKTWLAHATEFNVEYVRLPQSAFLDAVTITDAERDAYVAGNKDAIKKRYDEQYESNYNLPKRYTLAEIVLRTDLPGVDKAATKAKADEVAKLAAAPGADFAALARTWSEDLTASSGGNLGQRSAAQLDPVLVTAAEAAGVGKVSTAVETGRGYAIVQVQAIDDARVVPLEEAEKSIADAILRESKVGDVQRAYAASIVQAWQTTHAVPRDLTEARKLAVDQTGTFSLDSQEIPGLGAQPMLRDMLATAKVGDVLPLPLENRGTLYVVSLSERTDPTEEDYAAQKQGVRVGLLAAREQDVFEQWRQGLLADATVERMVHFTSAPTPAAAE